MNATTVGISVHFENSVRSKEIARTFFDLFASTYLELAFDRMGESLTSRRKKFDVEGAVEEWEQDRGKPGVVMGDYDFEGSKPARFSAGVRWHGEGTHKVWTDYVGVFLDRRLWLENWAPSPSERALLLMKGLLHLGRPMYGSAHDWSEFEEKGFRTIYNPSGRSVAKETISLRPREGLDDIYWMNYFGSRYVDIIGNATLEKIECSIKEQVSNGFLIVFGADPFQWKLPEVRVLQDKAKQEIDRGIFYDRTRNIKPSLNLYSKA